MSGIFGGASSFKVPTAQFELLGQSQDLLDFVKDNPNAADLLQAYRTIWNDPYTNQAVESSYWAVKGDPNKNISSLVDQFNTYKAALDAQRKDHAEYVKLVNERPGRNSLMMVDHVNPLAPTDPSKTVLG